mmetsp:Transcript_17575/g.23011  ORF Transcript_17575/g.23011 Transcript_17575/m.23011 type:complete len:726 (+) Transcript_17575:168-2345(+)
MAIKKKSEKAKGEKANYLNSFKTLPRFSSEVVGRITASVKDFGSKTIERISSLESAGKTSAKHVHKDSQTSETSSFGIVESDLIEGVFEPSLVLCEQSESAKKKAKELLDINIAHAKEAGAFDEDYSESRILSRAPTKQLQRKKKLNHRSLKQKQKGKKKVPSDPGARYLQKRFNETGELAPEERGYRYGDYAIPVTSDRNSPATHFRTTRFARDWEETVDLVTEQSNSLKQYVQLDEISGHSWVCFVKEVYELFGSHVPWKVYQSGKESDVKFTQVSGGKVLTHFPKDYPISEKWEECKRKNGTVFYRDVLNPRRRRGTMSDGAILPIRNNHVKKVVFMLHHSFPKNQVVANRIPFEVAKIGWGVFDAVIEIHFQDHMLPNKVQLIHPLDFNHMEVNKLIEVELLNTKTGESEACILRFGNKHMLLTAKANKGDPQAALILRRRKLRKELLEKQMKFGLDLRRASDEMDKFIESCKNKRMALGAIMAAALDSHVFDTSKFQLRYNQSVPSLRYVILDDETLRAGFHQQFRSGNRNDDGSFRKDMTLLSKMCEEGEVIDRFVSHSWHDDADAKFDALMRYSKHFKELHGRFPRLWIDIFCIDQDPVSVNNSVKCLPVYLMACNKVLCLGSNKILNRMWCLAELYTVYIMSSRNSESKPPLEWMNIDPDFHGSVSRNDISIWGAKCTLKSDEDELRAKLKRCPGGIPRVEDSIFFALTTAVVVDID